MEEEVSKIKSIILDVNSKEVKVTIKEGILLLDQIKDKLYKAVSTRSNQKERDKVYSAIYD